ncbi:hypothetical protein [Actinoplanes sp. L3-i22]|uniref:hypothetical protein n=1 Tax=Actinoplanes sp. L3-i22 TaxID=2836373 RepID=UPI001C851100|nr:hypothetical protein [Actinoplanes sp. L3-i22]
MAVAVSLVGAALSVVAFLSQRKKYRLEYIVMSSSHVMRNPENPDLAVTFRSALVDNAAITVIRIANTGYEAILADQFKTDLSVHLCDVNEILQAWPTATKPRDLSPAIQVKGDKATLPGMLLNPGDMMELQFLTAGRASSVLIEGRIEHVTPKRRASLPYPPGSGPEGELLAFDRFMWFGMPLILGFSIAAIPLSSSISGAAKVVVATAIAFVFLVIEPLATRTLIRRRRLWNPSK